MVKANAYGHGIIEISRFLEKQDVDFLGVGYPEEGIKLRKAGITKPIIVLVAAQKESAYLFVKYNLEAVISNLSFLESINEKAAKYGRIIRAHLFINTGMNREGIQPDQAHEFMKKAEKLKNINLAGLTTHLSTSDLRDDDNIRDQLNIFNDTLNRLKNSGHSFEFVHTANSGAVLNYKNSQFNTIRPGIAMYGYDISIIPNRHIPLKPVMEIQSKIALTRDVSPGNYVGYSRSYEARKALRIAVIPIGYGDGYPYSLSHKAECIIKGRRCPIVGTVCMDQFMVDIGDADFQPGDKVTIIGQNGDEEITVSELAARAGTLKYEILTSIAERIPRVYIKPKMTRKLSQNLANSGKEALEHTDY